MASVKKLQKIVKEIYEQLYRESDPPGDLKQIAESGEGQRDNWFLAYYLPVERQQEIIEEACAKAKLTKRDKQHVSIAIHLGYAPRGHKTAKESE